MIHLPESVNAWSSPRFKDVLKDELEALAVDQLPLQHGLTMSSHALEEKPDILVLGVDDDGGVIHVRIGVFYSGVVAGCSCADDPTPVEPVNEYCEMSVALDKLSGVATVRLVD